MKSLFRICLFCTCLSVGFLWTAAPSARAMPVQAPAAAVVSTNIVLRTLPVLAQSNESSSSGRVSGRGMRGLGKLAIFAVVALFGAGKWIFSKFSGGE